MSTGEGECERSGSCVDLASASTRETIERTHVQTLSLSLSSLAREKTTSGAQLRQSFASLPSSSFFCRRKQLHFQVFYAQNREPQASRGSTLRGSTPVITADKVLISAGSSRCDQESRRERSGCWGEEKRGEGADRGSNPGPLAP